MLILTRRPGETIMIGDDIEIELLEMQKTQVSIGITAPKSVEVHRLEVYRKVQAEKAGKKTDGGNK